MNLCQDYKYFYMLIRGTHSIRILLVLGILVSLFLRVKAAYFLQRKVKSQCIRKKFVEILSCSFHVSTCAVIWSVLFTCHLSGHLVDPL